MLSNKQLRDHIIQPALNVIGYYSPEAEDLMVGICAHESKGGTYLRQIEGPALGIYQMEPVTYESLWKTSIGIRQKLKDKLLKFMGAPVMPPAETMVYNLYYATMMARIFFLRVKEAIPSDLDGQAALWKARYNTVAGKGTIEQYISDYKEFTGSK